MSERAERRLAAIFAADVAGYSRLMADDEAATLATMTAHRAIMDDIIARHGGRIANTAGDSVLAEFGSVVDAVECANAVQVALAARNKMLSPERRMRFRIGIHAGDIMVQGGDLFGDGVNVAARLQELAEPGGICVSDTARSHLGTKVPAAWVDGGAQQLKNIDQPVRVFHLTGDRPAIATMPPALPERPSIAVLPFQNMSGDTEQDYFAEGIVEEITTALSRIRWLFVIARNSSFTYRSRAVDVKQIGRELGVRYVLEGSVRRAGDRVRITSQLVEAGAGTHLWADRFDGTVEDVFELQDRVTARVVGAIAPRLEQAEILRAQRKPTASLDAYDHYLRGMAGIHGWTREANAAAFLSFTRAIELDPGFAAAYGMAARCFTQRKSSGWIEDRRREMAEAERLARRAAEIGRDDAIALGGAAMALSYVIGDLDTASMLIDRALVLDPSFAWGWLVSGWIKGWSGQPDTAIEHVAQAMRLSPSDPHMLTMRAATGSAHFIAGRYDAALSWSEAAMWERPGFLVVAALVAASAALSGRQPEADLAMARLRSIEPEMRLGNLREHWPIRRADDLARWTDGLCRAGLPP
jgi:TolB-like protein/class 3 adenylate cyclase